MLDETVTDPPRALGELAAAAAGQGFTLSCEPLAGAILRTLAASKPGGRLLELGTGVGVGAAWLLDGMDAAARLLSVERNGALSAIARRVLGSDSRVSFIECDGKDWLREQARGPFDLIFADSWPGKFECFEEAWALLPAGGLYVIDDLLPQESWPDGHAPSVDRLLANLAARQDCRIVRLAWATGLIIAART